jgi:hypothetical protein
MENLDPETASRQMAANPILKDATAAMEALLAGPNLDASLTNERGEVLD